MELMMVKNEENTRRRRLSTVDREAQESRCVKRRKRDPAAVAVSCDNSQSQQHLPQKPADQTSATTMKRSSRFRGVSRHRWTGRFEAHLWDKLSWNATQKKKGKQGAYDEEESAARAYDLAALKYWGTSTFTNFAPRADDPIATQGPETVAEPQNILPFMANSYIPTEEPSFSHTNPFASGYLSSPQKQKVTRSSVPLNTSSKSSSPTALGLLLQSSIFRELVQKNANFSEDESTDGEETKNQTQVGSDDEFSGIFYDGIGNNPFVCSSNSDGDHSWSSILLNQPSKANATSDSLFFFS
ncbi:hypothetical protein ACE6H2_012293 [Prunus campanulata]